MSDLQSKVDKAFKDNANELKKLNDKLNNIVDLEYEVSDVSNNLKSASSGLKKLANKHTDYIGALEEFNSKQQELISHLSQFEPEVIQNKIDELEKDLDRLKSIIREESIEIKRKNNIIQLISITSTFILGLAIFLT